MTDHICDDHDPGTLSCRMHCDCRCLQCRAVRARYEADRRRGNLRRVPTDPARTAVKWMMRRGLTQAQIARGAGVSQRTIEDLSRGLRDEMYPETHDAVVGFAEEVASMPSASARLDATPLTDVIDTLIEERPLSWLLPDSTMRRIYYRAKERGWISLAGADRVATAGLGRPHLVDQLEPIEEEAA